MDRRMMAITAGAFPSLDTAVSVAFPAIDDHFSLAIADLQWIVICYLLPYGALLALSTTAAGSAAGRRGKAVGIASRLQPWSD